MTRLLNNGTLRSVNFGLIDDELPQRGLFGTKRLFSFLAQDLPTIESQDTMLSASEQVANLFGSYLTNRPLILRSPISPLRHLEHAVWELKTLDVRIFGWFADRDLMVIDAGCDVKLLKSAKLNYSGFISQTQYVRKTLGFTPNDYISGDQPNDILTNFVVAPRPHGGTLRG